MNVGTTAAEQITIEVHLPAGAALADLGADVREGLSRPFKELPPKYFYDERGSRLFEEITRLPEYYPTRAEREILERNASEIVAASGCDSVIELGSLPRRAAGHHPDARDEGALRRR